MRFSRSGEGTPEGLSGWSLKTQQYAADAVAPAHPDPVDVLEAPPDHEVSRRALARELPRKEVIQPHLPVRLPCYDFTPITSPTFDGSLPRGLGHRLRVLPAFVV
jgi:hypothetical protein